MPTRTFRTVAAFLSFLCVTATCCSSSDAVDGPVTVDGVHITVFPTQLDLSAPTAQLEAVVNPSEAPQGVTWSSSDRSVATIDATGLLEGVAPGSVAIRATSVDDATRWDEVRIAVACPDPRVVSATIVSADATWENWIPSPACFDYVVPSTLKVSAGVLTLEPGTVVGFEEDVRLVLGKQSGFSAVGTPSDGIILTGTNATRGHWDGVVLQGTQNPANRIEYTTIEYAGASAPFLPANLTLETGTRTTLVAVTLRESAGYGAFIRFGTEISGEGVEGGTFTRNALGPAYVFTSGAHYFSTSDTRPDLTGNDQDRLHVEPDQNGFTIEAEWADLGVPYRIAQIANRGAFTVLAGGALTLQPGVRVEFEAEMALGVKGGQLNAIGTEAEPIVLTGTEAVPGHWRGVQLETTDSELDHVIIEYGGGPGGTGSLQSADLRLASGGATDTRLTMRNSTLRFSGAFGFHAASVGVTLVDFSANTLTGNVSGPAHVAANHVDALESDGTYTGNAVDEIVVQGYVAPIIEASTWRDLGVPYHVVAEGGGTTLIVEETGSITFEPGVEVRFAPDVGVLLQRSSLSAIGTEQKRIRFVSAGGGSWRGFNFYEAQGAFDYVDLEDGGSRKWATVAEPANVSVTSDGVQSLVAGSPNVSSSGAAFDMAFAYGPTIGNPCLATVYIPPPDEVIDHCKPGH